MKDADLALARSRRPLVIGIGGGGDVVGALATAATAHASHSQQSIFQDDRTLLAYGAGVQNGALNDMQALGVGIVHADVEWYTLAPSRTSSKAPKVDLTDPAVYRPKGWAIVDSLVRGAQARGMKVLLTPTPPGPTWANGKAPRSGRSAMT